LSAFPTRSRGIPGIPSVHGMGDERRYVDVWSDKNCSEHVETSVRRCRSGGKKNNDGMNKTEDPAFAAICKG